MHKFVFIMMFMVLLLLTGCQKTQLTKEEVGLMISSATLQTQAQLTELQRQNAELQRLNTNLERQVAKLEQTLQDSRDLKKGLETTIHYINDLDLYLQDVHTYLADIEFYLNLLDNHVKSPYFPPSHPSKPPIWLIP